jgi:small subunit ribosomal protein S1
VLKAGDQVEAKLMTLDRKSRQLNLSIKAKDNQEEQAAVQELNREGRGAQTLGDLFKEQMDQAADES